MSGMRRKGLDPITGFTLIEILVTTVIILGIFISIAGILQKSVRMREKASEMAEQTRIGTAIIDIIRRDLNSMAFYPQKKSIYFSITPDTGPDDNRRDALSFDALVPFITESGIMIWRFGRVTYSIEEQFGMPEYKKLIRKTVYINNEYSNEDVKDIIKKELDEKKSAEGSGEEEAQNEEAEKEETGNREQEIMEDIAFERGLTEAVLSRRVVFFSIDVMSEDYPSGWEGKEINNRVPGTIKVSIGLADHEERNDGSQLTKKEMAFNTVLRPVIARYVSNAYTDKTGRRRRSVRNIRGRRGR